MTDHIDNALIRHEEGQRRSIWPKSISKEGLLWDNESLTLPPVGSRCRLVLTTHEGVPQEHIERDGMLVEVIAHIANGNLAACTCLDHWARSDDGEWWVAAFNDRQFQPVSGDWNESDYCDEKPRNTSAKRAQELEQ
ncbi:hypothetical protein C6W88_15670 [Halomonas litopenaei]|uniref:DUF3564 family protein n=1 Tax=Halomonas litopenaei TaxID=2109328 RepID=A0ABX5IUS2_9GAMM|nr:MULTISPECIES: hypothetical protein [Halomonas]PTL88846.1 hypothetical protein C6W89_20030 [Halomonas sp. SYSU XM8]PTL93449.1 hypothetical protein C6W88_15670 [Halomonas litopenaei]